MRTALVSLAEQLSVLAIDMGGKGEMPALLEGLAAVPWQAAGRSKADTTELLT